MPTRALLARGREAAERLMTDTVRVERRTGGTTLDPETGRDVPVFETVYAGRGKLSSTPSTGETYESGEHSYLVESPRLHLPIDVSVRPGDEAVVTATETENASVGARMRLRDLNRGTHRTAQRWNVEVITG
ncbi:DUF6093 family protein [Nesterenkonia lacusekhoensis]|uniref:Uncharacterized protein n=1 Tax=Nesterenkonia lacusekhoensis TaxID=150832 RepID=A0ABS4SZ32_9MICC|nr:hypothetical protein [Nesterenkonia lacusekhoensis]